MFKTRSGISEEQDNCKQNPGYFAVYRGSYSVLYPINAWSIYYYLLLIVSTKLTIHVVNIEVSLSVWDVIRVLNFVPLDFLLLGML